MVIRVDGRRARVVFPPLTEQRVKELLRWMAYWRWLDDLFAGVPLERAGKR